MAKTEITTPDGIKIKVDGTPEEVARILDLARRGSKPTPGSKATGLSSSKGSKGLPDLLGVLRSEKFFKEKRGLGDVTARLAEIGSHYSGTTVGKQLLREVRARRLRRLKQAGKWVYVQ